MLIEAIREDPTAVVNGAGEWEIGLADILAIEM
jgi:hypothetical protein